jgi:hypothetical protein
LIGQLERNKKQIRKRRESPFYKLLCRGAIPLACSWAVIMRIESEKDRVRAAIRRAEINRRMKMFQKVREYEITGLLNSTVKDILSSRIVTL